MMATACADHGSDLAIVYRGDVASYRALVHVRIDTGARARDVTPSFPSAAHPAPVPTEGMLPLTIALVTTAGDTAARYSPPALQLAPHTSYRTDIVVAATRPDSGRCTGPWTATAITPRSAGSPAFTAESLYVSIAKSDRRSEQPHCED